MRNTPHHRVRAWLQLLNHTRAVRRAAYVYHVPPLRYPRRSLRSIGREAESLLDAVKLRTGLSDRQVFEEAFRFDTARGERCFWSFIRDTSTCPPEVLTCAERLLEEKHAAELV